MARKDTEIEIKVPLERKIFLSVKEKLKKTSRFIKKSHQQDEYFVPGHRNFLKPKYPFEWLTIRRRDGRAILNYKHLYPEDKKEKTHSDEYEVEIGDAEKLEKIFSVLDFRKFLVVEKKREVYNYQEEFEIALDTVRDLGHFIEIEATKDFGSPQKTREKLFEFARGLGINILTRDKEGYALRLMRKKGFNSRGQA